MSRRDFSSGLRKKQSRPVVQLKGKMQNVIVVKPQNSIFRQAVFFLKDDYFLSSDLSRSELLKQAREAAAGFTESELPPEEKNGFLLISLAVAALLVILLLIIIYLI